MAKKSFVMYESWAAMIAALPDNQALQLTRAICAYQLGRNYVIDDPIVKAYFESTVLPEMDENARKYQAKVENANATNKKRNANSKSVTQSSESVTQNAKSVSVDVDVDVDVDEDVDVNDDEDVNEIPTGSERDKRESADYKAVVAMYNDTCVSFPRIKSLSEARKKAIKARLKTHCMADMQQVFTNAEASEFLKGSNSRNWSATFDWMMNDRNFTKILDGNYNDRKERARSGTTSGYVDAIQHRFDPINDWLQEGSDDTGGV